MFRGTRGICRTKSSLLRPSGDGEPWGKLLLRGGVTSLQHEGGWMLINDPPDGRHIMQVTLAHAGHMGSMIPEAHVKWLVAGPAVSLMGCWIRGG